MTSCIDIVILAAGEGKRMGTEIPKPFRTLHGKSFLARILESLSRIPNTHRTYIVTNDRIQADVARMFPECTVLVQSNEKGTAKALQTYTDNVPPHQRAPRVLVLPADIPLVPPSCLTRFVEKVSEGNGIIVFRPEKDGAYGRVISNCDGTIEIVEATDCTYHHESIILRNTGVYLFTQLILASLSHITNDNVQHEYYLTDLFKVSDAHVRLHKIRSTDNLGFYGVNTMEELTALERMSVPE